MGAVGDTKEVSQGIHYGQPWPQNEEQIVKKRAKGDPWSAGFATYSLEWQRDRITRARCGMGQLLGGEPGGMRCCPGCWLLLLLDGALTRICAAKGPLCSCLDAAYPCATTLLPPALRPMPPPLRSVDQRRD